MEKILCIYHACCHDGFGAAMAVLEFYGEENVELLPAAHGPGLQAPDCTGRKVVILDISYPLDQMKTILEQTQSLIFIDHHKSAVERLGGWIESEKDNEKFIAILEMGNSAATLAWRYFVGYVPELMKRIEDVDIYLQRSLLCWEIYAALTIHPHEFALWKKFIDGGAGQLSELAILGAPIIRDQRRRIGLKARAAKRIHFSGVNVLAVNADGDIAGETATFIAKDQPFGLAWNVVGTTVHVSLRSTEAGLDVAKIAMANGGGGHARASGFELPIGRLGELFVEPA